MTAAQKLRLQLQKSGLSQLDLAEVIGVEPVTIHRLTQRKEKEPAVPLSVWLKISEVFGTPVQYWAPDDIEDDLEQTRISLKALDIVKDEAKQTRAYYQRMKYRKKGESK